MLKKALFLFKNYFRLFICVADIQTNLIQMSTSRLRRQIIIYQLPRQTVWDLMKFQQRMQKQRMIFLCLNFSRIQRFLANTKDNVYYRYRYDISQSVSLLPAYQCFQVSLYWLTLAASALWFTVIWGCQCIQKYLNGVTVTYQFVKNIFVKSQVGD